MTDDLHIDVDVGPYVPATMVPYLVTIVIPDGDPRLDQKAPELPARWYEDPTGRHQLRYWDGGAWTEHVSDDGITGADPLQTG